MPLYDCGDPDCGECKRAFRRAPSPAPLATGGEVELYGVWADPNEYETCRSLICVYSERAQAEVAAKRLAEAFADAKERFPFPEQYEDDETCTVKWEAARDGIQAAMEKAGHEGFSAFDSSTTWDVWPVKAALATSPTRVGNGELRAAAQAALNAFDALIWESEGVYGLHKNGDPAPWSEITAGGRFEEWTAEFEGLRAALRASDAGGGDSDISSVEARRTISRFVFEAIPTRHGSTSEMADDWGQASVAADNIMAWLQSQGTGFEHDPAIKSSGAQDGPVSSAPPPPAAGGRGDEGVETIDPDTPEPPAWLSAEAAYGWGAGWEAGYAVGRPARQAAVAAHPPQLQASPAAARTQDGGDE